MCLHSFKNFSDIPSIRAHKWLLDEIKIDKLAASRITSVAISRIFRVRLTHRAQHHTR